MVIVPGWKQVFAGADETDKDTQILPSLAEGALCPVSCTAVTPRKPWPPEHYTEGTLIIRPGLWPMRS